MLPQPVYTSRQIFEANWSLIESVLRWVSKRHGLKVDEAEEFLAHASLKLIEDDYGVIRKFRGKSSLRTYLTTVITRLFLDYRTARWGKWRPSAAARRAGPVGVRLDRLIFRDGLSRDEAVARLAADRRIVMSPEELAELARQLPAHNPRRGEWVPQASDWTASPPADAPLLERELARATLRVQKALLAAVSRLPAEDRLLLRLRFRDDLPVAKIAGLLRLEAKGLYRRIHRVLVQLHRDLSESGIRREDVAEVLTAHGGWLPTVIEGGPSTQDDGE